MEYIRLCSGLKDYTLIPITENIWDYIKHPDSKDYYSSIFIYNEEHYQTWKSSGSVSGITDVYTNKLIFDFDDKNNINNAKQDTISLVTRLLTYGIKQDAIQLAFSGNKGFSVEIETTSKFSPKEFKTLVFSLAADLKTFDTVVNDSNRVFRVAGTKNLKSGLYKFPLTLDQLVEFSIPQIKELAKNWDNVTEGALTNNNVIELSKEILSLKEIKEKKEVVIKEVNDLDLSKKPKWLSSQKYALQEGYFQSGERNHAFMILASSYKNQGFSKEIVYRMLKGVAEKQALRNSSDPYSNDELWLNITNVVFSPNWKGGSYSYDNTPLLRDVGDRLGIAKDKTEESSLVPIENITSTFRKFALDIEKNTIKLGIPSIDDAVRVTTSMSVGLLAGPGAGKTTVSLGILNANSLSNVPSLFFSLDMGAPLVYQRLIQRHLGYSSKKIFSVYQNNEIKEIERIEKIISDNYKNVKFCFRSGLSIEDIRNTIIQYQETKEEKIRLVVLDYLEVINGPFSDSTANSGYVAQAIKDIANDLEITVIVLLQPQKSAGDPSAELMSYRNIKGSSQIEQSLSVVFTLWRPGFSPSSPEEDKYASIAVVKNRMGSLAKFDFAWNGLDGTLEELDEYEKAELEKLIEKKLAEKLAKDSI
jgi:hypothetical protein